MARDSVAEACRTGFQSVQKFEILKPPEKAGGFLCARRYARDAFQRRMIDGIPALAAVMELNTPIVESLSQIINGATAHKFRIIPVGRSDGGFLVATDRLLHRRADRMELHWPGSTHSLFPAPVRPVLFETPEFEIALHKLYPSDRDGEPYSYPLDILTPLPDECPGERRLTTLAAAVRNPDIASATIGIDHDHGWQQIDYRQPSNSVHDNIEICDAMDSLYLFIHQTIDLPRSAIWRFASGIYPGNLASYRWTILPGSRGFGLKLELVDGQLDSCAVT